MAMLKRIRHRWDKITRSGLLKHEVCSRCKCQKWYDLDDGWLYTNRFGKTYRRAPYCVIPNTPL